MAPRLSRLAAMPNRNIPEKANSIESGIARATMPAARRLPRKANRTTTTSKPALEQVVPHRADDVIDQFGAVVDGLDLHIRGERGLDLVQAAFEVPCDFVAVLARQHETQAENHFAPAVCGDGPSSNLVPDLHVGHVLHPNGHALLGRHHDVLDLLDVDRPADAVDQEHLAVLANVAATDVAVVSLDGLHDLVEGQAVLDEPGRIDPHLILLFVAAPGVDFGSALDGPQFRLDDPIVDGAKLRNIVALTGHDVVEDLAQPRRYRPQLRMFDAGRYLTVPRRSLTTCRAK